MAHYVNAKKMLASSTGAGTDQGEGQRLYTLKFTVAEALGHPWAAPEDGQDPATTYPEQHSVLVFGAPRERGLAVRGLKKGDVATLVRVLATAEDYTAALGALDWGARVTELQGQDVLVCAHASRDAHCAKCGPPLVEALREVAAAASGKEEVRVWPSSHVGGHRYAGNALVMSGSSGDWYGNLHAEDPRPLRALIEGLGGKDAGFASPALRAHWRGCRGLDEVQQEAAVLASGTAGGAPQGAGGSSN